MRRFREPALLFFSAMLLSLPYHFGAAWPAAFVAFLPYFFVIEGRSSGDAFKASFLLGSFFWLLTGFWLMHVTVSGFFLLVAYLALYFAAFGLACADFLSPRGELGITLYRNDLKALVFLPAFWVALEWLRGALVFGGLPWSLLAYSQWRNLPFIQISDLTGAYGVSFFVMAVNVGLFKLGRVLRRRPQAAIPDAFDYRRRSLIGLALALAVSTVVVGSYGVLALAVRDGQKTEGAKKLRVSVLQGNIPQDQKWDAQIKGIIFEKYKRLTFMSAVEKSDLIVWPETSFPGYLEDEPVMSAHLRSAVRQSRTEVLVGAPTIGDIEREGVCFFNSAVHYGADGEEKKRYNKLHLVPFGEYVPLEALLGALRHFVHIGNFTAGLERTIFTVDTRYQKPNSGVRFAALICFEDIFPGLVRGFVRGGAEFLVNITNDAWFGKTSAPYQHAAASVFRAVENRVPVVRAANTGYSCFISSEGRILSHVEDKGEPIFVTGRKAHDLIVRKPGSFYTYAGDVFVFLCFVLCFLAYRDHNRQQAYAKL